MTAISNQFAQWFAILSIEELVWQDVAQAAVIIQQTQALLDEDGIQVIVALAGRLVFSLVVLGLDWVELLERLDADIRRVAEHDVEAAMGVEDLLKSGGALPVEGIDAVARVVVDKQALGLVTVEVGTDEGVAALDVGFQLGEQALAAAPGEQLGSLGGLALQQPQGQGQFGDLDRLVVDVHAVDVVGQDAALLIDGEAIISCARLGDAVVFERFGAVRVLGVPVQVPAEQLVICSQQEAAGTAGGVEDMQLLDLGWGRLLECLPDGMVHDVLHDIPWGVVDAAGFLDFGLFLHLDAVLGGEADGLAQKLLIDVAQDGDVQHRELVGALRVVDAADDVLDDVVVDRQVRRQRVLGEVEESTVVPCVGLGKELQQARVLVSAVEQRVECAIDIDATVLGDAQEHDAVNRLLDGEVELMEGQVAVAQRDVARQLLAPLVDEVQELLVDFTGAPLAARVLHVLVEGAVQDGFAREGTGEERPLLGIVLKGEVLDTRHGGTVIRAGLDARVIDGEFLEVGQDGQRQFGRVGVAAQLIGGTGVVAQID